MFSGTTLRIQDIVEMFEYVIFNHAANISIHIM